jgi:hypothetical protein
MRRDNFDNIVIDGAGADPAYEGAVAAVIETLRGAWTGWAVLRAIYVRRKNPRSNNLEVRIVPFTAQDRRTSPPGTEAFARPNNWAAATARGGRGLSGGYDDPSTPRDERYDPLGYQPTGEGSSCEIHFNPREGKRPDINLLHEMVHVVREMSGVIDRVPTEQALRDYDDEEEFYPDVVTNIYLSERGEDNQIRFGHSSRRRTLEEFLAWDPLEPEVPPTAAGFLTHPGKAKQLRRLLSKMKGQTWDMCDNIAHRVRQTARWNVLREFMDNPTKYPSL